MNGVAEWPIRLHEQIGEGDEGTLGSTVPWMRQLVLEGRRDPLVREHALAVIHSAPHMHPVEAIFRHVQAMPYKYDEEIVAQRGLDGETSELLQGAPFQIARALAEGPQAVEGDCDDRAILTQSMLESLGYETRFVLVRGPKRPDYSHVYSEVKVDGQWVPLDTIFNGTGGREVFAPGEEVGAKHGARDRVSIGVDVGTGSILGALVLAGLLLWRRS